MHETIAPKIPKWPFFLGDALLLALAWFIHYESKTPTGRWEILAYVLCVAVGAAISLIPFLKEYQAAVKFSESDQLVTVVSQIKQQHAVSAMTRVGASFEQLEPGAIQSVNEDDHRHPAVTRVPPAF